MLTYPKPVWYAIGFLAFFLSASMVQADDPNFYQAKRLSKSEVYFDRTKEGELYCDCDWRWVGASGGRVDHDSCGYEVRKQPVRAARTEWEHIVPASTLGSQRQCWQNGGRRNCRSNDPVFAKMEGNMHNLAPVVGEVNADRSNYNMGMATNDDSQYGQCGFKVDFKNRVAEPPDSAKGLVARTYFYMADRYDLRLSSQEERILIAWDRSYPVSSWERERDRRISGPMGHSNPFVTGEAQWTRGHKNSRDGLVSPVSHGGNMAASNESQSDEPIHGNRNSNIYHLPSGCPSYNAMADRNKVEFDDVEDAVDAGYRKAGNCR